MDTDATPVDAASGPVKEVPDMAARIADLTQQNPVRVLNRLPCLQWSLHAPVECVTYMHLISHRLSPLDVQDALANPITHYLKVVATLKDAHQGAEAVMPTLATDPAAICVHLHNQV